MNAPYDPIPLTDTSRESRTISRHPARAFEIALHEELTPPQRATIAAHQNLGSG